MKKTFLRLGAFMMLAVMLVSALASCSSYGKISKNFEEAGYSEVEFDEDTNKITAELKEAEISCTAHLWQKKEYGITFNALVLEFGSEGDIDEAINESETIKGFLKDLQQSEFVRDNCLLVPLSVLKALEMLEVFNK